jgi:hypothetical protein
MGVIGLPGTSIVFTPPNVGVDAAARIKTRFAAPSKLRQALPPLASNDLAAIFWESTRSDSSHQTIQPPLTTSRPKIAT